MPNLDINVNVVNTPVVKITDPLKVEVSNKPDGAPLNVKVTETVTVIDRNVHPFALSSPQKLKIFLPSGAELQIEVLNSNGQWVEGKLLGREDKVWVNFAAVGYVAELK